MSPKRLLPLGVLVSLAMLALAPAAHADSGGLDTTYPSGGRTFVPTPAGTSSFVDTIQLADGSIVGVGTTGTVGARNAFVAKVLPGGGLDATFGAGGVAVVDAGGDDFATGITLRTNGGFVVTGADDPDINSSTGFIAMLTPGGLLDATWGAMGIVRLDNGGTPFPRVDRAMETPSGDAVYAGIVNAVPNVATGVVDGTGQWLTPPNSWEYVNVTFDQPDVVDLARRADGTYVALIAATSSVDPDVAEIIVASFAEGVASTDAVVARTTRTRINDAFLVNDATVMLVGSTGASASSMRGALWRLGVDGTPDASFGTGGELLLPTASEPWSAVGMDTTSTGGYFVTGTLGADRVRTLKLTSTFALDASFAQGGIADRSYGATPNIPTGVHVDSANRPVVLGSLGGSAAAWRIELFDYASTSLGEVTYSPNFVQRLNTVTFGYSVRNAGPDATDVTVDVDLPASVEDQAFAPAAGTIAPAADRSGGTWTVPKLAAGATATLQVTGKPGDVGMLTTTATILAQSAVRTGAAPAPATTSFMVYGAATPRDDVITLTPRNDTVDALSGNDIVYALEGDDTVDGNVGDDQLFGALGNDIMRGGEGNDLLEGDGGDDDLDGGNGTDRVTGGDGDDVVAGGAGDNILDGGAGNDRMSAADGNDTISAGDGTNVVSAGAGTNSITSGAGADAVTSGDGDDTIIAGGGANTVSAGAGTNSVTSGAGDDTVTSGAGDDTIATDGGNDRIDAGDGMNRVDAGNGNDTVAVGNGFNQVATAAGNDRVVAGDGTNRIDTGSGHDRLATGSGNDVLQAGTGNDVVDGGAGNDVVDAGAGNDAASGGAGNDRVYGRAGNDRLHSGDGNDLVFAGPGNDHVQGGHGADRLYGETGNDYLIAQGSGDKLYGGPGRDRLDGGAAADAIWGGTGADWINGKTGNDYLVGNHGNDWIRGYLGNDRLYGGNGRDLLNGGAGRDVLSAGSDNDIIRADDGFGGDVIDCGSGWDIVYANVGDRIARNCEYVKYDVPAGTRYARGGFGGVATFVHRTSTQR